MNRNTAVFLKFWVPVILWLILMIGLSSIPGQRLPKLHFLFSDKLAHIAEFCVLGFLFLRALSNSGRNINLAKAALFSIIIISIYAALDEWHQALIPGRIPDIFDFAADFIGINIGIFFYRSKG